MKESTIEQLVSLPARAARDFRKIEPLRSRDICVASDPPGKQLGSGGGTAHLLAECWRHRVADKGEAISFSAWLDKSRKLLVHGSGESRRLPAYASIGKPLIPVPTLHGIPGQRPEQALIDLQIQAYERMFWYAPESYRVMVTCGDVLLRVHRWLPQYPDADVLILGMASSHEEAQHHGVILCPANDTGKMACFVQKPTPDRLRELEEKFAFYLDIGVWMFSERAISLLMKKCGWDDAKQEFRGGQPSYYDLFTEFGTALGETPAARDSEVNALTCAVVPLSNARFYHFGTNATLLTSVSELMYPASEQRSFGHVSAQRQACVSVQNSVVQAALLPEHRHIWIENSNIPAGWRLSGRHVLTGVPANKWAMFLEAGVCLDFTPVDGGGLCIRAYGFDDPCRGAIGSDGTSWVGRPAPEWFSKRGLDPKDAGIASDTDIYDACLFPVMDEAGMDPGFIEWLFAAEPARSSEFRRLWLALPRLSARQLLSGSNLAELVSRRAAQRSESVQKMTAEAWLESCSQFDLACTAEIYAAKKWPLPEVSRERMATPDLPLVHDRMFRYALASLRKETDAGRYEEEAFGTLKKLIVEQMEIEMVQPARNLIEDQIVWGRAPVRLDLAGGWTDTPPYCIEHGGHVVNVAVDLNGQPPIQVFGRLSQKLEIVIRSIDLGIEEHVKTYDDLRQLGKLGSGFGIAKAALSLAGFEPRFHARGARKTLEDQLKHDFGGGIELSMVCAIPKGSGLGTSSILAATLLGTLSEMCGLKWSSNDLFARTLALEQMLTSGGGWQDQVGGVIGGIKFIETMPGIVQKPVMRWLPNHFFSEEYADKLVLLYYTGLTRVAHDILGEIVRGMFLNSARHLGVVREIGYNALYAADALQRDDWNGLCEAVRRSWNLNQRLDSGTNPPSVQAIMEKIGDYVSATKLLGAGGGGYMVFLAKDVEAAGQIRRLLAANPPNDRARFVDVSLSTKGFQVTRS